MKHMTILHKAASLAALILLTACATQYRTPDVPLLARYGEEQSSTSDPAVSVIASATYPASDVAADPWWRGFGDEHLDRLIDDVLARNRDLISATLKLERARLQQAQARNQRLPSLSGSAVTSDSASIGGDGIERKSASANLTVQYEQDLFGTLRANEDSARWQTEATAEDRESAALLLVANICDLYWQLGDVNARLQRGETGIATAQRVSQLVDAQYRAGAVSRIEREESQQAFEQQLAAQSALSQQRSELRHTLAALRDGERWPSSDEPFDAVAAMLPIDTGIPAQLLGRRPDLRAVELRLRQSLAQSDATRLSAYPAINLSLSASGSGESLGDVIDHPLRTLSQSLLLPFLDFNNTRLRIAVSRKDYDIAANDFRRSLVNSIAEVEKTLAARNALLAQSAATSKALAAAATVERLYAQRYRAGAVALRVWLNAQESRRNAEASAANIELALRQNDVALAKAVGGSPRPAIASQP